MNRRLVGIRPYMTTREFTKILQNYPRFNLNIAAPVALAVFLLPDTPALAALNCSPVQRGTLSADGATFTPGTSASDIDVRLACTGGGPNDVLTADTLNDAYDAFTAAGNPDVLDEPGARAIVDIGGSGARVDLFTGQSDTDPWVPIVVRGTVRGADGQAGVNVYRRELTNDLNIDSYADVQTTGGGRGVQIYVPDETPDGRVRLRNFGKVVTTGEGTPQTPRRGHGVSAISTNAAVEVSNEAGATIETRGNGGRGLYAEVRRDGTARAINRGRVVTKGAPGYSRAGLRASNGVRALSGASAEAVNEAGATIRTEGAGASGLGASGCFWTGESCPAGRGGTASAINRGSITTTGDAFFSGDGTWLSHGVQAGADGGRMATAVNEAGGTIRTEGTGAGGIYASGGDEGAASAINRGSITTTGDAARRSDGRTYGAHGVHVWTGADKTARAVNEAGGTIRTEGTGARGLSASHDGAAGRAEAENKGEIFTVGGVASGGTSSGINVWSSRRSAYGVNHEGAEISTDGAGARGMSVSSNGGPDDSAIGINRGTITTTGNVFVTESVSRIASGLLATAGFSGESEARLEAVNEATGVIETRGTGARGIFALTGEDGSGAVQATNRGRITTRGDVQEVDRAGEDDDFSFGAHGVSAATFGSSSVTAVNEVGGIVETHGTVAFGLEAYADGAGAAKVVNKGRVTTHQTASVSDLLSDAFPGATGARGAWAYSGSGNAVIENEPTGRVETKGARAFGLFAEIDNDGSRTSAMAEVRNKGTVITGGWNADAVVAIAHGGGTADNPSIVRAINEKGAAIRTAGDGAGALSPVIHVRDSGTVDAFGSIRAENHGTIETSGGLVEGSGPLFGANGVNAAFFTSSDSTTIGNAGDVTVVNTGRVTVTGAGVTGLVARTYGTGAATVSMTGGGVTASHADDAATGDVDEGGIGIWAETGAGGSIDVTVSGSAEVTAPTAVRIAGGAGADKVGLNLFGTSTLRGRVDLTRAANGGRFTVRGGFVDGDVRFGAGDDDLRVERRGYISGDIDFGAGMDTLVLDVRGSGAEASNFEGAIRGLEEMYKRGAGVARVNDVEFSGSALTVEEGGLTVAGHLNLGSEGTLTVQDQARLTFEVGDITVDATNHGQITAGGGVTFQGEVAPGVSLLLSQAAATNQEAVQTALQQGDAPIDVLGEGTEVMTRAGADSEPVAAETVTLKTLGAGGAEQQVGTLSRDGKARVQLAAGQKLGVAEAPAPPAPPVAGPPDRPPVAPAPAPAPAPTPVAPDAGGGGSGSDAGKILIGGGAIMAAFLFDLFGGEEEAAAAVWEEERMDRRAKKSFAGIRSGHYEEYRVRAGGLDQWTRSFAGSSPSLAGGAEGTVQGVAMGLDARVGRSFHFGFAAMPDVAVSSPPGPASGFGSSLEGGYYAARGGWRASTLFADASFSHGSYRARSLFDNPAAGGVLGGEFSLVQNHVRAKAGARLGLGGVRATPSLSLFSGSVRQGAYTAQGAALRAEVPDVSQRYHGWKAGLDLAPSRWLGGPGGLRALRWRPGLHLGTTRTSTRGPSGLDVRQWDKAGVLSFTSRARVQGMPRTVHSIGASLTAMWSDAWRLRMGYAGMVVDGEPVHAAVAAFKVRF